MRDIPQSVARYRTSCIRSWLLVFLLLVAVVGLSLSVRAEQVHYALHATSDLTINTKANVRAHADMIDLRPAMLFARYIAAIPSVRSRINLALLDEPKLASDSPWYSVVVKHRPPPPVAA